MPVNQKIRPLFSDSSSVSDSPKISADNPEEIILSSFKIKPAGIGGTRNTLVENDSLSSYSWPEETSLQNAPRKQSEVKADDGAIQDLKGNQEARHVKLTRNKDHIVIDIDTAEDTELSQDPSYIEAYIKFMYWTCISPFDPKRNISDCASNSWIRKIPNVFQKTCFAVTTIMALLQAFFFAKYYIFLNFAFGNLENFITMAFHIMSASTQVYYIYLFVMLQNKVRLMLKCHRDLRAFRKKTTTEPSTASHTTKYAIILGSISLIVSLVETIWVAGTKDWTPETTLEHHCIETAEGLYLWSSTYFKNYTEINEILEKCEKGFTIQKFILGGFGILIYFFSSAQMEAIENLMLMDAETLKEEIMNIEEKIGSSKTDENNLTLLGFLRKDGEWEHIKLIIRTSRANNGTFDPLMKYKHVDNLMLFVFFMLKAFDGDFPLFLTFCMLYSIIKTSYMYRIATEASTLNDNAAEWVRRISWKTVDKELLKRVPIIFNELEKNPVGMGNGQFTINENFLFRFLGSVGSVFILQAQSREVKTE